MRRIAWGQSTAQWAVVEVPIGAEVKPGGLRIKRGRVRYGDRDFGPLDDCIVGRDLALLREDSDA